MVARFLLFRRQSPVGMPQQPYWQARQFVSKKKSLSIIAWSACCTAVSKPSSRSLHTPSMVVPPGEHTAFMSAIGCSELFIASAPLPITVAVAISSAIGLANSARTPASARASMYIKTNAPDAPPRAPNAGNRSSSIWYTLYALPTDENIASAVFICALVAALPPHIAVTEAFYT